METKLTRPDLSDITKMKFANFGEFYAAVYSIRLSPQETIDLANSASFIPELIQIAEMYFDEKKSNPESLVFQMASKVLNDIKPERYGI